MKKKVAFIGGGIDSVVGRAHYAALHLDGKFDLKFGIFSKNRNISYKTAKIYNLEKRNINNFKRYDFFFFIPIKLSRSGYSTSEFPVTRSYPDDGSIPTHIPRSRYLRLGLDLVRMATSYKKY